MKNIIIAATILLFSLSVSAIGEGGKNPGTGTNEPEICPGCNVISHPRGNPGRCSPCIGRSGDACVSGILNFPSCSS